MCRSVGTGAARARDVAVAQCADEAEGRRTTEALLAESENRPRLDTASKLEDHRQKLRAQAEMRGAHAALEAEEGLRRAKEARVPSLGEETDTEKAGTVHKSDLRHTSNCSSSTHS